MPLLTFILFCSLRALPQRAFRNPVYVEALFYLDILEESKIISLLLPKDYLKYVCF
jgi:hypothetical protein